MSEVNDKPELRYPSDGGQVCTGFGQKRSLAIGYSDDSDLRRGAAKRHALNPNTVKNSTNQ
jgi:hypothetical protein